MALIFLVMVEVKTCITGFYNRRKQNEDHKRLIFFLTGKTGLQTQIIFEKNWNQIYFFC